MTAHRDFFDLWLAEFFSKLGGLLKKVTLQLDEATARDLFETLEALGEHWAAGASIPYPAMETIHRLTTIYEGLAREAGFRTIDQAMQEAISKHRTDGGDQADG